LRFQDPEFPGPGWTISECQFRLVGLVLTLFQFAVQESAIGVIKSILRAGATSTAQPTGKD